MGENRSLTYTAGRTQNTTGTLEYCLAVSGEVKHVPWPHDSPTRDRGAHVSAKSLITRGQSMGKWNKQTIVYSLQLKPQSKKEKQTTDTLDANGSQSLC